MKKVVIQLWIVLFFFALVPWQEISVGLQVPATQAAMITVDAAQLSFSLLPNRVQEYVSPFFPTSFPFEMIAIRWKGSPDVVFQLRIQDQDHWSSWKTIEIDHDMMYDDTIQEGEYVFSQHGTALQYRILLIPVQNHYPDLQHFQIGYLHSNTSSGIETAQAGFTILPRSAWGADESLRFTDAWKKARDSYCQNAPWACAPISDKAQQELDQKKADLIKNFPDEMKIVQTISQEDGKSLVWPKEYTAKVRKIVLHHTGEDFGNENTNGDTNNNTNQDTSPLTAADYQARIRSIYYYHTVIRGWGDIGYHFIIDPLGNVYEGRSGGDRVTGAHVAWNNEGSIGVALMGNYNSIDLGARSLNGVVNTLVYLSKKYNLDPEGRGSFRGKDLPNIIGHRDLSATACPGDNLYTKLPQIRTIVGTRLRTGNFVSIPILGDVNQANDQYSAQYVSNDISEIDLPPTSTKTVRLRFKNTGTVSWGTGTHLEGCCSFDPTLDVLESKKDPTHFAASMEQTRVDPGDIADFVMTFQSGYVEKVNIITFTPVINDQYKVQSVMIPVAVTTPNYSYDYVSAQYPSPRLFFGQQSNAEVTLKNTGNITWVNTGENAIVLKPDHPRWRKTDFHPDDPTVLGYLKESTVLPGQVGHFIMHLTAPSTSKLYEEYFTPYIKQVGYLKDKEMVFRLVVVDPQNTFEYAFSRENTESLFFLPGEQRNITVTLKNRDDRRWDGLQHQPIELLGWDSDGDRIMGEVSFDKDRVEKNETVKMFVSLKAPQHVGRHVITLLPRIGGRNLFSKKIDMTIIVMMPTVTAELVQEQVETPVLHLYDRTKVKMMFKNTGNIPWKKGEINLGKLYNRDRPSIFYDESWLGALRPATVQEDQVLPGEIGTFEFYIMPKVQGVNEESYQLGVQGYGWVSMNPVKVRVFVPINSMVTNASPSLPADSSSASISLRDLYQRMIRVKLGFSPADDRGVFSMNTTGTVSNGISSFVLPAEKMVSVQRQSDGTLYAQMDNTILRGTMLTLTPVDDGIITIHNWERYPSWDTHKTYNDNRFRGNLILINENAHLVCINQLPLESYVKGVAEVPENEHYEKKKVMSILARTYALFYMDPANRKFPGKIYDASDDPNVFQKYLGYTFEMRSPGLSKAVEETKGMVITYQGKLIKTPYFNQSDGRTRSAQEVWGWTDTPYLVSVPDPLCPDKTLKGHGVGLSGCGAEKAAELGQKYDAIIQYYYKGVDITKIP
jgi:hypothetical protein